MKIGKILARTGVLLFSALCLIVFQFANSILLTKSNAYAQDEFPTLPPNTVTLAPAVEGGTPAPTPISTLEPEEYFEEDDPNRPEARYTEKGDDQFGYGPANDEETKFLMWFTDEDGTHYRLVDSTSQILFGSVDPVTGQRRDNGFNQKVEERESLKTELAELNVELRGEERATNRSFGFSGFLLGAGLVVCILASAGLCTLATPIVAAGAVAGMGFGVQNSSDYAGLDDQKDAKISEIENIENKLGEDLVKKEPPLPDS